MMKRMPLLTFLALAVLLVCIPARAQTGCDDSPENPTLVLAGLAAGAYGLSALRTRLGARQK